MENNNRAFQISCVKGDLEKAKWLFSLGARLTENDHDDLFGYNSRFTHLEITEWLYSVGQINISLLSIDSFAYCCFNGNLDIVKWLYDKNEFDIHVFNEYIFRWCCWYGNLNVVKWLYSLGGLDSHAINDESFRWACSNGHLDVCKWLYDLGSLELHALNDEPFRCAAAEKHVDIILWLLECGTFPGYIVNKYASSFNNGIIALLYKQKYIATNPVLKEAFDLCRKKRVSYLKKIISMMGRWVCLYNGVCHLRYSYLAVGFYEAKRSFESSAGLDSNADADNEQQQHSWDDRPQ
ncbi:MAG: hypothetical protein Harvfovirus39_9 [Harvfovirus sp.]|uniref:Uncharacterized protein n=1 Tax=Harvfovirus sp. TaxID=2487768 RepID=A0A3G5A314_9VIRU|nr:MAG: hypothetical protein Harvfovirus39_9 [Harvfovirus sp.]